MLVLLLAKIHAKKRDKKDASFSYESYRFYPGPKDSSQILLDIFLLAVFS